MILNKQMIPIKYNGASPLTLKCDLISKVSLIS